MDGYHGPCRLADLRVRGAEGRCILPAGTTSVLNPLVVTQRTGQRPCFYVVQTSPFLTLNLVLMRIRWFHDSGSNRAVEFLPGPISQRVRGAKAGLFTVWRIMARTEPNALSECSMTDSEAEMKVLD